MVLLNSAANLEILQGARLHCSVFFKVAKYPPPFPYHSHLTTPPHPGCPSRKGEQLIDARNQILDLGAFAEVDGGEDTFI